MFFWRSNKHRSQWWASIVEKPPGTNLSSLWDFPNPLLDEFMAGKIVDTYQGHSSIIAIKWSVTQNRKFKVPHATTPDK